MLPSLYSLCTLSFWNEMAQAFGCQSWCHLSPDGELWCHRRPRVSPTDTPGKLMRSIPHFSDTPPLFTLAPGARSYKGSLGFWESHCLCSSATFGVTVSIYSAHVFLFITVSHLPEMYWNISSTNSSSSVSISFYLFMIFPVVCWEAKEVRMYTVSHSCPEVCHIVTLESSPDDPDPKLDAILGTRWIPWSLPLSFSINALFSRCSIFLSKAVISLQWNQIKLKFIDV